MVSKNSRPLDKFGEAEGWVPAFAGNAISRSPLGKAGADSFATSEEGRHGKLEPFNDDYLAAFFRVQV